MKEKTNCVFVVLTYRNTVDVIDLLESIKKCVESYKVIIVNSFYDDESASKIKATAEQYGAVFINIENKGYSYGNNRGIEYAINNYEFNWLIVANPDTVIKKFELSELDAQKPMVIAPDIVNLKNKKQNPMHKSLSMLSVRLLYRGFKRNSKFLVYSGISVAKIKRAFSICKKAKWNKKLKQIYSAHGSFVMFSHSVFDMLGLPYDENIFLFGEEGVLAEKLRAAKIPTYYYADISVLHKEDGSMKFRTDINEHLAKANIYVYEKYFFNKGDKNSENN